MFLVARGTLEPEMQKPEEILSQDTKRSQTIDHVAVDHLVVAAPSLELATEYVAELLGIRPDGGGAHPGRGTHNALFGLGGGAYLEAIGADPSQPEPKRPRPFGIDQLKQPKLVTWALRASGIDSLVAELKNAQLGPVQSMSRRLESGDLLQWRLAFPRQGVRAPDFTQVEPFLIDWGDGMSPGFSLAPAAELVSLELSSCQEGAKELVSTSISQDAGFPVTIVASQDDCDRLLAMIETPRGVVEVSS